MAFPHGYYVKIGILFELDSKSRIHYQLYTSRISKEFPVVNQCKHLIISYIIHNKLLI